MSQQPTLSLRDLEMMKLDHRCYTLEPRQFRRRLFPNDKDGSCTRRRLRKLFHCGLLNRTNSRLLSTSSCSASYAYFPSAKGVDLMVEQYGHEESRHACTLTPKWQHLPHWVAVADTQLLVEDAVADRSDVALHEWIGEWSLQEPDSDEPNKRYRLHTLISQQPKLVCCPDSAFLLESQGIAKAFYLEQDRDTTKSAKRLSAQKAKGYAALATQQLHREHFPTENAGNFSVLMIVPDTKRRDMLQKAFAEAAGAELWKFAALPDLTRQSFLTEPVFRDCHGKPTTILQPKTHADVQKSE